MGWRSYYDDRWEYFQKSTPRAVKGGIKAQSQRGAFGESWWAKRWIGVLESFQIGARLGRGRSYARRGQVVSIDIQQGVVKAAVQGSRPKPYQVTIRIEPLSPAEWKRLAGQLATQAIFAAKLLAGQMPEDIEEAFKQAKLSLFPAKLGDLKTDCSCPDWSNPCKHIAAVYYLLGEEFDRDPFLIFRLRGIEREELVRLIGAGAPGSAPEKKKRSRKVRAVVEEPEEPAEPEASAATEPLLPDPATFWSGGVAEDFLGEVRVPATSAALPQRLGSIPFWRSEEKFQDAMRTIYDHASTRGLDVFLGQQEALADANATSPTSASRPAPRRPARRGRGE
jgi:uncharacterized Zn finger protein